jgi:hypothetical protein
MVSMAFRPFSRSPHKLDAVGAVDAASAVLVGWGREALTAVRTYPPVPPGSRYVRTFNLQRSWFLTPVIRTPAGGIQVSVRNSAEYANLVIGPDQRPYHRRTGWPRLREFMERRRSDLYRRLKRAVESKL